MLVIIYFVMGVLHLMLLGRVRSYKFIEEEMLHFTVYILIIIFVVRRETLPIFNDQKAAPSALDFATPVPSSSLCAKS